MCTYNTLHQRQTAIHVIYIHIIHIKHIHNNTLATLTFNCLLTYKFTYIRREKTFLLSLLVVHFPTTYISTKKKNIKIISSIYTLTATIFFFNLREIIWLVNTIEKKKTKRENKTKSYFFCNESVTICSTLFIISPATIFFFNLRERKRYKKNRHLSITWVV